MRPYLFLDKLAVGKAYRMSGRQQQWEDHVALAPSKQWKGFTRHLCYLISSTARRYSSELERASQNEIGRHEFL